MAKGYRREAMGHGLLTVWSDLWRTALLIERRPFRKNLDKKNNPEGIEGLEHGKCFMFDPDGVVRHG